MTSREVTKYLPREIVLGDDRVHRRTSLDWAWVLAFGAIQWPWLLRSLSGGSRAAKADLLRRLQLSPDALPHLGSWKADSGLLGLIVDHIEDRRPRNVVEFGAGASTLVAGRALQLHGGGTLVSFDQDEDFVTATRAWLLDHGVDADLRAVPLAPSRVGWPGLWYDHGELPTAIDMLLIDGPPWTIHPLTRGSADALFDRITPGGVVILDDAARPGERMVARRWRNRWPEFDFRLAHNGTKGTLIGTRLSA